MATKYSDLKHKTFLDFTDDQVIIDEILDGDTELGGGLSDAQRIINRIEEFKKRAKENF